MLSPYDVSQHLSHRSGASLVPGDVVFDDSNGTLSTVIGLVRGFRDTGARIYLFKHGSAPHFAQGTIAWTQRFWILELQP